MRNVWRYQKLLPGILGVLLFVFLPLWGNAAGEQVTDRADLLSDAQEAELFACILRLEEKTGWDLMAVTTDDTEGKSSQGYAEDWYEAHLNNEDGAVCLIDMDHRMLYVSTFGEAIDYLTDERIENILDNAYVGASEGDFYAAFADMLGGIESAYDKGIPDHQYRYDVQAGVSDVRHRGITLTEGIVAVVLALLAGGGTIAAVSGSYKMKWGIYRYSCREHATLKLTEKRDHLTGSFVTHRRIRRNPSGGGHGHHGSSVHRTSGGRHSGGGGRRF